MSCARVMFQIIIVCVFVMKCIFLNMFFFFICIFYIECENGIYEDGCQTECIHCLNMTQCHLLNGTCSYGCKPGYRGPKCHRSKFNRTLSLYGLIKQKYAVESLSYIWRK